MFESKYSVNISKNVKKMDAQKFADLFNVYITTNWFGDIDAWVEKPQYDEESSLWTFPGNEYLDDEYAEVSLFVEWYTNDTKNSLIEPGVRE